MLTFTPNVARDIVKDCHPDFDTVSSTITDKSRWSYQLTDVFIHIPTGKYYTVSYSIGATELQDESPFEYENGLVTFQEVIEKEVLVKKWILV
jgi:hypothetical protein